MKVQAVISLHQEQPPDGSFCQRISHTQLFTGRCMNQSSAGPPVDAITRYDLWINNKSRKSCIA